jgi:hypothetical protein
MPDAPSDPTEIMPGFLDLRTWVDYREGADTDYSFHVLVQGIKGEPVGRWPLTTRDTELSNTGSRYSIAVHRLQELRKLRAAGEISEAVRIEYEQKILSSWLEDEEGT